MGEPMALFSWEAEVVGMAAKKEEAAKARPSSFIRLVRSINEPGEWIARLVWSPNGRELAAASKAGEITIIDPTKSVGAVRLRIPIKAYHIYSASWSPDGKLVASSHYRSTEVHLWDATSGRLVRTLQVFPVDDAARGPATERSVRAVAWSPDGTVLATGGDGGLVLWEVGSWNRMHSFLEQSEIISARWSPDGRRLASTSYGNTLCVWDPSARCLLYRRESHYGAGLAWSPDSTKIAASGSARTVCIWDAATGRQLNILEGHTDHVRGVDFSADGLLLATRAGRRARSKSLTRGDARTLLWRTDTWQAVGSIRENPDWYLHSGIAFAPNAPLLALSAERDRAVHIWEVDVQSLLKRQVPARSVYYRNAKVALVGDSGVGKSGLAMVLTGSKFVPTESTHGRRVRVLSSQRVRVDQSRDEIHEIVLWDLAGQPGYRLIHQLHLEDVGLALIVFDSKGELDPFSGVRHWNRAILQASRMAGPGSRPITRLLVAARTDRGRVGVSRERLASVLRELEVADYLETSAKEGTGVRELGQKVTSSIAWDSLPMVTSNSVFQQVRSFLLAEKRSRRVLATMSDLLRGFVRSGGKGSARGEIAEEFRTCIFQLQALGLVRALSFGGLVVLRPEIIDGYASAMIMAAKREPDGMGSILEEVVVGARFEIPKEERVEDKETEKLLLLATIEDLLRHEIALRETTDEGQLLIFPSQLTRENPDLPDPPGKEVAFEFKGPILNIYATLIVRLTHSNVFRIREMWKDAATFQAKVGGVCGLYLTELGEGRGTITLFYEGDTARDIRLQFCDYVSTHLTRRALPNSVSQRQIVICRNCATPVSDIAVSRRIERGHDSISCNVCETTIPLTGPSPVSEFRNPHTIAMDRAATGRTAVETALVSAAGEMQTRSFRQWTRSSRTTLALVFTDVVGSTALGEELGDEQMDEVRHAHFERARQLIAKREGYEIKTIGDSFMVAFRTAAAALDFALELQKNTGHERIEIRAGIHVGPISVEEEDAFGTMVNYTARVQARGKGAEIWLSDRAHADIQQVRAKAHRTLKWIDHDDCELKGLSGKHRLWELGH